MLESEAIKKWCPFARAWTFGTGDDVSAVTVNRGNYVFADTRCVGSACMAWRWFDSDGREGGYCGLAGEP